MSEFFICLFVLKRTVLCVAFPWERKEPTGRVVSPNPGLVKWLPRPSWTVLTHRRCGGLGLAGPEKAQVDRQRGPDSGSGTLWGLGPAVLVVAVERVAAGAFCGAEVAG